MIFKFLKWVEEKFRNISKTPWARFETGGIQDGTVRYDMSWNPAFLENLKTAGFQGHNEQEIVESFFLGSLIIPKEDALNAEVGLDSLTPHEKIKDGNRFRQ